MSHHSDGVYGSLIINQPQPLEPHLSLYDYDRSGENTLIIGATFPELLTAKLEDVSELPPDALVINGDGDIAKYVCYVGINSTGARPKLGRAIVVY